MMGHCGQEAGGGRREAPGAGPGLGRTGAGLDIGRCPSQPQRASRTPSSLWSSPRPEQGLLPSWYTEENSGAKESRQT